MTPRPAMPRDAAACADILRGWIDATPWMPRIQTSDNVQAFYRDHVLPLRSVWVIGAPVAGFLALDRAKALITDLYVATPGRGLGRFLLRVAKAGRDRLDLWTFQANSRARAFYARERFAPVRMTDVDNDEGLPDVPLRRQVA